MDPVPKDVGIVRVLCTLMDQGNVYQLVLDIIVQTMIISDIPVLRGRIRIRLMPKRVYNVHLVHFPNHMARRYVSLVHEEGTPVKLVQLDVDYVIHLATMEMVPITFKSSITNRIVPY